MADCSKNSDNYQRRITALLEILKETMGAEKIVLKAGKVEALPLLKSADIDDRILGLKRIVYDDPTLTEKTSQATRGKAFMELEAKMAEKQAKIVVENELEAKVEKVLQERQGEFLQELRKKLLKAKIGPDNAQTLKKYAELEYLEERKIATGKYDLLRPKELSDIIGQDKAVGALLAKIASPFPQHVILYGPPGVGKTTAARLALEAAKKMPFTPFREDAEFVEADGTTLRWDPRESTNPLLGSVHDPIYQGARLSYAEEGIPEPKTGLVTQAHGGILFIDEIGEMDSTLQNKLLKVLEDKRINFYSSYYDAENPHIPKYIKKLFEEGAPADFILIGATTRQPHELSPAIRSRTAQIFFEPLLPEHIEGIVKSAAARLQIKLAAEVGPLIASYTSEGRKAVGILADAYGIALFNAHTKKGIPSLAAGQEAAVPSIVIKKEHVLQAVRVGRLLPNPTIPSLAGKKEVGKVFGLGVTGFLGSLLEIEAIAFPAGNRKKGLIRFNDAAGTMTRDALFNARCVLRKIAGIDCKEYDLYVNLVGGGRVDGPSAGVAIFSALYSAIKGQPIDQDVAITGELSIQGKIKPVGGILEKLFVARQAGIRKVYYPKENRPEIPATFHGLEAIPVETIEAVIEGLFAANFGE